MGFKLGLFSQLFCIPWLQDLFTKVALKANAALEANGRPFREDGKHAKDPKPACDDDDACDDGPGGSKGDRGPKSDNWKQPKRGCDDPEDDPCEGTPVDPPMLIVGDPSPEAITGGDNNDELYGSAGDDTIEGGNGADYLAGNQGDDDLIGGCGADTFGFDGNFDREVVKDFNAAEGDRLEFIFYPPTQEALSAEDVFSLFTEVGEDLVLNLAGSDEVVVLEGVGADELSLDDITVKIAQPEADLIS